MKFILLLPLLFMFFTGLLFAHENPQSNFEIEALSESPDLDSPDLDSPDFDTILNFSHKIINISEIESQNLENSELIQHFDYDYDKLEGFNVLKFPQLSWRFAFACNANDVGRLQIE